MTKPLSSANKKLLPSDTQAIVDRFLCPAKDRVEAAGELQTESGSFCDDLIQISFASYVGGKVANEDYIAFAKLAKSGSVEWAAAIADGLSGSLLGDVAAELACIVSLAVISKSRDQAINVAHSISVANRVLRRIGCVFEREPERFCPSDMPISIWKRALESGKVLQTTLNLIWSVDGCIQVVAVGDGGLLYSVDATQDAIGVQQFGTGKLDCIGPKNVPQNIEAYQINDWNRLACFTDGLTEVVQEVESFADLLFNPTPKAASNAIRFANAEHADLIEDNLSVIRLVRQS